MGELAEFLTHNDTAFRKARLPALYADFRPQRTLNPDGYSANVTAWRHALSLLARRGLLSQGANSNKLILSLDDSLLRELESRQFGQPLALGTVVRESIAAHAMFPAQTFLQAQQSVLQRSWSGVPWAIVGWTLRQIGLVDPSRGDDTLPKGQYVLLENVEAAAKQFYDIMAEHTSKFDRVFTKSQFYNTFASDLIQGQRLSEADINVLLCYLSRDKGIIEYDGSIVRVKGVGDQTGITEDDKAIASLKEVTLKVKHQADLLSARIDELELEAKKALARKNKVSALAALRQKKVAEQTLSTRYATLGQLEETADKIEQAADNVAIVHALEASSGVLRSLNARAGSPDKVGAVMDELRERAADADELAAILAESTDAVPVDEGEVDDELAEMEREAAEKEDEKQAETAQGILETLPQVPATSPQKVPAREKSPTSETGIGKLSLAE
ncbi:Snf7 [Cordyceps fumosorosea ARSEF 2679]|uniref:Snf7 n=1 Tax=Cordyceps fumosorosea (strain ARSEF 2679) TaxID=1081104 RepID=A0A162MH65_CORFA|nr:Snf7 [Cordyceps fumosorosea ARSEF 2679]OAA55990.1 Snf7 [Cordyceps fumosorosea ARSEF 2679]